PRRSPPAVDLCPARARVIVCSSSSAQGADQPRSRLSTFCGAELACATIAVPACCRIWARVRLAVSAAKSVSRMRLREADRLAETAGRRLMPDWKRFWIAPSGRRRLLTEVRAWSTLVIVAFAPATLPTERVLRVWSAAVLAAKPTTELISPAVAIACVDDMLSVPAVESNEA